MIICQTKPENLFSIETLCFWAYQNSIFWNDESTILLGTMCNYHEWSWWVWTSLLSTAWCRHFSKI
jgi:hypothetical protein